MLFPGFPGRHLNIYVVIQLSDALPPDHHQTFPTVRDPGRPNALHAEPGPTAVAMNRSGLSARGFQTVPLIHFAAILWGMVRDGSGRVAFVETGLKPF